MSDLGEASSMVKAIMAEHGFDESDELAEFVAAVGTVVGRLMVANAAFLGACEAVVACRRLRSPMQSVSDRAVDELFSLGWAGVPSVATQGGPEPHYEAPAEFALRLCREAIAKAKGEGP